MNRSSQSLTCISQLGKSHVHGWVLQAQLKKWSGWTQAREFAMPTLHLISSWYSGDVQVISRWYSGRYHVKWTRLRRCKPVSACRGSSMPPPACTQLEENAYWSDYIFYSQKTKCGLHQEPLVVTIDSSMASSILCTSVRRCSRCRGFICWAVSSACNFSMVLEELLLRLFEATVNEELVSSRPILHAL